MRFRSDLQKIFISVLLQILKRKRDVFAFSELNNNDFNFYAYASEL